MSYSQLRPLSIGELLDGGFTLYRRHFPSLVLISLITALPIILLNILLGVIDLAGSPGEDPASGTVFRSLLVILVATTVALVSWGALTYYLSRAYLGLAVTPRDAL